MEVADGGSGDQPLNRARVNIGLYVLALLLALGCVVGGVLAVRQHHDRQRDAADQALYGAVLASARDEVTAFINIDYRNAQQSIDAVGSGATGEFAKQYDSRAKSVRDVLENNKSVMDGQVLWAGVVDVDSDSATVIAATQGTVANVSTKNKPVARSFRIKVDLVKVDGSWRTSNLEFVG